MFPPVRKRNKDCLEFNECQILTVLYILIILTKKNLKKMCVLSDVHLPSSFVMMTRNKRPVHYFITVIIKTEQTFHVDTLQRV